MRQYHVHRYTTLPMVPYFIFTAQHKKQDAYFIKEEKKKENIIDAVLSRQAR